MIPLEDMIKVANDLAPFPESAIRLSQLLSDPDSTLQDLVDVIRYDEVLTTKIIRAANTAADARTSRVTTVQEAIGRLGTTQTMSLTVASAAKPHLEQAIPAYELRKGALWRHSIAAAAAAETIPLFCETKVPPEVFTSALLHDIGKLVMGQFLSEKILHFLQLAQEIDGLSLLEAESLILSVHHGEIGGIMAQHWQLPQRVIRAIIYHHTPDHGFDEVCDFTFIADRVAEFIEASLDNRTIVFAVPENVAARVGSTPSRLEELCPIALSRYNQIRQRYNAV